MASALDRNHTRDMQRLLKLWDDHADRGWEVDATRHGTNVALVNAYVSHAMNLARGVLVMHEAGLRFESVSLVRSTMEMVVSATWLVLYPEMTPDFMQHSATERRKLLIDVAQRTAPLPEGETDGLEQIEKVLARFDGKPHPDGRYLKNRFEAIAGGRDLYTTYRILCTWDHGTNSLADVYSVGVEQTEENPWGLLLLNHPNPELTKLGWLGLEVALVLRAQIAADTVLTKPRHKTQLNNWARQLGVSPNIARSE